MGDFLNMLTSSSQEAYGFGFNPFGTGTISSFLILRDEGASPQMASLYISSLYFGNLGGTTAGQLTTDGTATDLFWNGSKLNNQGGGGGGSGDVTSTNLTSTTLGLGTLGYVSSAQLISTTDGLISGIISLTESLGDFGYISTSQLTSTVEGLGTLRYISSVPRFLSTNAMFTSSLVASTISATNILFTNALVARSTNLSSVYVSDLQAVKSFISSLQVDELLLGTGDGWTETGPLRATYISSLQENTGSLYATNIFVGNSSTLNQIRFWGLQGNYNNTILAEVSTGTAVGAQEFLVFKGSSASDRIRFQTTGDIRFEPQVAAREFSTATALAIPTMILQSNLVGIATASPVATLDVRGTAFATVFSTQQLFISSINGVVFSQVSPSNLVSTPFLDTTLISTVDGINQTGYLSTIDLANLVSTSFLDTSLISTVNGINQTGYLSTIDLANLVSTSFLDTSLISTVNGINQTGYLSTIDLANLVSTSFLDTSLISTVNGIIQTGYLSTAVTQIIAGTNITISPLDGQGIVTINAAGGGGDQQVTSTNLTSTTLGLGTLGYISSIPRLLTTSALFTSSLVASTISTTNILFTTALVARSTNLSSVFISNLTATQGYISSLTTDSLTIGDGNGWFDVGALRAVVVSSIQETTGSLYATTAYIGATSTTNQVRFWGITGAYNNTVLAENGTTGGSQEFLVFKGSSAFDRIRFQTTGDIRFEPQVAARDFSNASALATPTMILQSNFVGIATASPAATLDVRGTAFATTLSTQQLFISSINGTEYSPGGGGGITAENLVSTVDGLGTLNYISGPVIITSNIIALDSLAGVNTAASTLKLLGLDDLYEDFPVWNSSNQIEGSDPEPAPLRLDIFGSARILKNLYVGSTTTILTTAGVQAQQVSSLHTTASTLTLSDKGPLFVSTNAFTTVTDMFLNDTYIAQRPPVLPVVFSSLTTNMELQPEFIGIHFILQNSDSNFTQLLVRADATFVSNVPDGWYCYLKQFPDSNVFNNGVAAETDLGDVPLPDFGFGGGASNYMAPMKFIVSGGAKIPY
jgi:hypothetical protein